jgi:hypothetical protein
MQKVKHTPGPWEDNGSGMIVGPLPDDDGDAPFVCDVCEHPGIEYTEEQQANARLIEAAPEMLEELERAADELNQLAGYFEHEGSKFSARSCRARESAARAIIAKARATD